MKRRILCMAGALLGCAAVWLPFVCAASERPRGPADDRLVFARNGWIWQCDGDGRGRKRLTRGALPGIGPDGRFVAFFRPAEASSSRADDELWVHDGNGGTEVRLAGFPAVRRAPEWSGDGSRIAVLIRDKAGRSAVRTLRSDGSGGRTIFFREDGGSGLLRSLSFGPDGSLLVHDGRDAFWLSGDGTVRETAPLARILGREAEDAADGVGRMAVCPTDETVLVFDHPRPGAPRPEKRAGGGSRVLTLHDRWVGTGKNLRITPREIDAFDPVWSQDGRRVYFVGRKAGSTAGADECRIYRTDRFGGGLRELGPGENVRAGSAAERK